MLFRSVFGDGDASYVCTLARVDGQWRFAGASGTDEMGSSPGSMTAVMSTEFPDGTEFSSLHGYVDDSTAKVVVTLASGVTAEASIASDGTSKPFAVWFPVPVADLTGATITATTADGDITWSGLWAGTGAKQGS